MSNERRNATRFPVDLIFNAFQAGQSTVCEAVDISTSGMAFRQLFSAKAIGDGPVQVELQLPGERRPVEVQCEVVRSDRSALGLEFRDLTGGLRARIESLIRGRTR